MSAPPGACEIAAIVSLAAAGASRPVECLLAQVTSTPQTVKESPRRACGYALPHPDQGLIHRPTNGGHCGGDASVLRLRAAVARTNWRGLETNSHQSGASLWIGRCGWKAMPYSGFD